jgi:hypothetical protein
MTTIKNIVECFILLVLLKNVCTGTSMMLPDLSKVSQAVTGPCSAIKETGHYKCMKIMDLYKPLAYLTI